MLRRIVLDTNCLIQSISHRSPYYRIWADFIAGRYLLCVTTSVRANLRLVVAHVQHPDKRDGLEVCESVRNLRKSGDVVRMAEPRTGLNVADGIVRTNSKEK